MTRQQGENIPGNLTKQAVLSAFLPYLKGGSWALDSEAQSHNNTALQAFILKCQKMVSL